MLYQTTSKAYHLAKFWERQKKLPISTKNHGLHSYSLVYFPENNQLRYV